MTCKRFERELLEVADLLQSWQVLAECQYKSAQCTNDFKQKSYRNFKELMACKDEILILFRDSLTNLKKIELHPSLWKDPSQKLHLSDIYYAEGSMHSFKQSCVTSLERLALKIDSKPISVPKAEHIDSQ